MDIRAKDWVRASMSLTCWSVPLLLQLFYKFRHDTLKLIHFSHSIHYTHQHYTCTVHLSHQALNNFCLHGFLVKTETDESLRKTTQFWHLNSKKSGIIWSVQTILLDPLCGSHRCINYIPTAWDVLGFQLQCEPIHPKNIKCSDKTKGSRWADESNYKPDFHHKRLLFMSHMKPKVNFELF